MLGALKNYILKRKAAKIKRKVIVHNLGTAKSALILYVYKDAKQEKVAKDFARFMKEEGIKANSLAYIPKKIKEEAERPKEELGYQYFDKKELSWLGIPNSSRIKKIIRSDFDLMIDLNLEEVFPIKWISILSKASFKVGGDKGYQTESCDLLLGTDQKTINALQEQCRHYLNMINRKN